MICYRDKTFCTYHETCAFGDGCERSLTPEVLSKAREWWGGNNPPISFFTKEPTCFTPLNNTSENVSE